MLTINIYPFSLAVSMTHCLSHTIYSLASQVVGRSLTGAGFLAGNVIGLKTLELGCSLRDWLVVYNSTHFLSNFHTACNCKIVTQRKIYYDYRLGGHKYFIYLITMGHVKQHNRGHKSNGNIITLVFLSTLGSSQGSQRF